MGRGAFGSNDCRVPGRRGARHVAAVVILPLLLAAGAMRANASLEKFRAPAPQDSPITVIPNGQREIKVSWTLRSHFAGSRVVLYAGDAVGHGVRLAEMPLLPGLHSYQFVDRSERRSQWLYWLVVVDPSARSSVLGTLVCVSPSMSEGAAPSQTTQSARAALAEWPATNLSIQGRAAGEEPVTASAIFLRPPPEPPPE